MKKILLFALLFITHIAYAQPDTWLLYGSGNLTRAKDGSTSPATVNTSWELSPGIGYQFDKHSTAGIRVGYEHLENNAFATSSAYPPYYAGGTTINLSLGCFYRYTQTLNNIFFLFGQGDLSYTSSQIFDATYYYSYSYGYLNSLYSRTSAQSNGFAGELFFGAGAKVYRGLALNFSFGGISYTSTGGNLEGVKANELQLTFGRQINFGISDNINWAYKSRTPEKKQ